MRPHQGVEPVRVGDVDDVPAAFRSYTVGVPGASGSASTSARSLWSFISGGIDGVVAGGDLLDQCGRHTRFGGPGRQFVVGGYRPPAKLWLAQRFSTKPWNTEAEVSGTTVTNRALAAACE